MIEPANEYAGQIAEIEALLQQPMPDIARRSLEATLQALCAVRGTASVGDTLHGNAVGVNYGIVQAFFGNQPPNGAKELLDNYLEALIAEHAYLRLGKLLGKEQTGREQAVVPALSLRAVYTSLATNHTVVLPASDIVGTPGAVLKALDAGDPSRVLPEAVRWGTFAFALADDTLPRFAPPAAVPRIAHESSWRAARSMVEQARRVEQRGPAAEFQVLGWYRPELAVEAITAQPRLLRSRDRP
jgi:hypothetical protein